MLRLIPPSISASWTSGDKCFALFAGGDVDALHPAVQANPPSPQTARTVMPYGVTRYDAGCIRSFMEALHMLYFQWSATRLAEERSSYSLDDLGRRRSPSG
nr:hypothetical protein CFP56_23880 [Quercus suber]